MLEKHEVCCDMMHGFDWTHWTTGTASQRLGLLPAAQEHVLQQDDGKARFSKAVTTLSRAFALCAAHDEAIRIRDDISFFQAVRAALVKPSGERRIQEDRDQAVRQLVSKAITASNEVIDVFSAAGLKKPDISILSDGACDYSRSVVRCLDGAVAARMPPSPLGRYIRLRPESLSGLMCFSQCMPAELKGLRA